MRQKNSVLLIFHLDLPKVVAAVVEDRHPEIQNIDGVDGRYVVFSFAPLGLLADQPADVGEGPFAVVRLPADLKLHDDVLLVGGLAVDVIDHLLLLGVIAQLLGVQVGEVLVSADTVRQDRIEEGDEELLVPSPNIFLKPKSVSRLRYLGEFPSS